MSEEDERQQLIEGKESPSPPYGSEDSLSPNPEMPERPSNPVSAWMYDHRASIPGYGMLKLMRGASIYSLYVLFILLLAYLLNQLDRYTLPIVTTSAGYDLQYGDRVCMKSRMLPQKVFDEFHVTKNITDICSSESYFDEFLNETLNVK